MPLNTIPILGNEDTTHLPTVSEFYLSSSLYKPYDFDGANHAQYINRILTSEETIDCYCIECNLISVFADKREYHYPIIPVPQGVFIRNFTCLRRDHTMTFVVKIQEGIFTKIGQYPSLADLAKYELDKYRNFLGKNDYREFSKAVGLTAHGVGIGAFVYLRRIFERLIEEAHQEAIKLVDWDDVTYSKSRIDEKISLLKNFLPLFLSDNKIIYSVLSKGIHELSEEECLETFPVVKAGIELILDEKIEKQEKEKKISDAEKAIQKVYNSLKSSGNTSGAK